MLEIMTVNQVTSNIKNILEESFNDISVIGELSNFKAHFSGHWYFTLKDTEAQISATMWKGLNSYVFFTPQDGMRVIVNGRITVYPPRGNYQIDVRAMKPAGIGDLQLAFEKLKKKLFDEGLFDEQNKKPLPDFPVKIGVVTSIDGAALKDMISVAKRRFPVAEIVISSCTVQGKEAVGSIIKSIQVLNKIKDIDLIIIARGGGSIEDLWAFNEEEVARAIFASKIPIITGIGHEVDFTIADFVADLRAATPTAAMEIALPDKKQIYKSLISFNENALDQILNFIDQQKSKINNFTNLISANRILSKVRIYMQLVDSLISKMQNGINYKYLKVFDKIKILTTIIQSNSIDKTLKKGFVIVKQQDKFVQSANKFIINNPHTLLFYDGEIKIENKNEKKI